MVFSFHNFCVIAVSTAFFSFLYSWFSPRFSHWLYGKKFGKLSKREQTEWNERIVSSVHAVIASIVSTAILVFDTDMQNNPVWANSLISKTILGFTWSYMAVGKFIVF